VIGLLSGVSPKPGQTQVAAFHRGLNEAGYREGQNVVIEYRWAEGHYERLPALAADLIGRQVAVIVANPAAPALAAQAATKTVPIVFLSGADPVKSGLVASLNRPGGNITGVSWFSSDLGPKRLGLIHELVPKAAIVALIVDKKATDSDAEVNLTQAAARTLGVQLVVQKVRSAADIDAAFANFVQQRAGALVIGAGAFFNSRRQQIIALAARHAVPTIYANREQVQDGGLMSYGNSVLDAFRRAGVYTSRILKGEKPADLPVELTAKFELLINLKTAKAFGLDIPPTLLARTDDVIE
jgi:putative ABC transport system substrate-binding protein